MPTPSPPLPEEIISSFLTFNFEMIPKFHTLHCKTKLNQTCTWCKWNSVGRDIIYSLRYSFEEGLYGRAYRIEVSPAVGGG